MCVSAMEVTKMCNFFNKIDANYFLLLW